MENINAYMESGMLELYVLGDLCPTEQLRVEAMASIHPEVKIDLYEIGYALEQYALKNAIEPNALLRHKVLNCLATG